MEFKAAEAVVFLLLPVLVLLFSVNVQSTNAQGPPVRPSPAERLSSTGAAGELPPKKPLYPPPPPRVFPPVQAPASVHTHHVAAPAPSPSRFLSPVPSPGPAPAPAPLYPPCEGVDLLYQVSNVEKIYPYLNASQAELQPYSFEATATITNMGFSEVKNWAMGIRFQHDEVQDLDTHKPLCVCVCVHKLLSEIDQYLHTELQFNTMLIHSLG